MTREEAIQYIDGLRCEEEFPYTDAIADFVKERNEAIDMAIEALSVPEHDGCDGCRYEQNGYYEYPCKDCEQNYLDMWEQKPSGTPMYDKDTDTIFVRKHGIWKFNPSVQMDKSWYICSVCGHDQVHESKFCPNCGSEMDVKI